MDLRPIIRAKAPRVSRVEVTEEHMAIAVR